MIWKKSFKFLKKISIFSKPGKSDMLTRYIIFILEHDLFKRGKPIYFVNKTIDIKDEEGNYLPFDDACNIMYINGQYRGDNPLGKLMHDFSTSDPDEMYYEELARRVRFHKQNEKGVQNMCKIVEEYGDERAAEALQKGILQGEQKKAVKDAIMLIKEYDELPEIAAQKMNAPLELVLEGLNK